jgi:2,5-furandicarboxylate decarboxylase 1
MDDTASAPRRGSNIDLERFRLRTFLASLGPDELEIHDAPMALSEVAAVIEGNRKAVWFKHLGAEGAELVGNVTGSRERLAQAFGVDQSKLLGEVQRRLRTKPEVIELGRAQAPVQQVVMTGEDADLTTLPLHLQHGADGGLYISASVDYAIDTATGFTNVGFRRLMLRGRRETGIDLVSPSDLRAIYLAAAARGENLPVSFVIGCHPIDMVGAMMRLPVDELGLVGSLRDAPLPVVKCITNDIRVPADAEWVIEGYLDRKGHVEPEGPYGEFLGYYGAVKLNPVFHVTAITRRHDALFQTATISGRAMANTETAQLGALRCEIMIWRALETAVREPVNVFATPSSGGNFNVRIALRQRVPGEARNAIQATFASLANVKHVFVVDPDVDIFSDAQMDWALATRFQADRDLVVVSGMRGLPLDPSLGGEARVTAKAGFDLTWPFGMTDKLETTVPEPPTYDGKRFASLEAALADGPKSFEELMAALGTRDGREVVRALEPLYRTPGLARDPRGKYKLK